MSRSHLTLAALAASAVEGLEVSGAMPWSAAPLSEADAALVADRDGRHWIIRVPRSAEAEAEQSADLVALRALGEGVRARLPFAVSRYAGQAPIDGTRAVVSEFVPGARIGLGGVDASTADSAGRAIAAIHALPTSVASDAGLPVRSSIDALGEARRVVERALDTRLVPTVLVERWKAATSDPSMWQFEPTLVNGSFGVSSLLVDRGEVSGVVGWHALHVGDPALDLHWVLAAPEPGIADAMFAAYGRARGSVDRRLEHRARFLNELELARWLLHGTQQRSTEIVDDAIGLMSRLVDDLAVERRLPIAAGQRETLDVDAVEELLDRSARLR